MIHSSAAARPRFFPASLTLLASGAAMLFAGAAEAGQSCDAAPCPSGFTCEVVGASGGCGTPACPPGQPCAVPDCAAPTEIRECVPGPCVTNADCASGMVCFAHQETMCSGSTPGSTPPSSGSAGSASSGSAGASSGAAAPAPCYPGTNCNYLIAPPACTTTTVHACVPRYELPCQLDIDCGDGFSCIADQACSCGGSVGTGTAGAAGSGAADRAPTPLPVPPNGAGGIAGVGGGTGSAGLPVGTGGSVASCTCWNSGTARCQAREIVCTADRDCPSQWTCQQQGGSTDIACGGPAGAAGYAGAPSAGIGGMPSAGGAPNAGAPAPAPNDPYYPCTTIVAPPQPSRCVPPYYTWGINRGVDGRGTGTSGIGGSLGIGGGPGAPPRSTGGSTGETAGVPTPGSAGSAAGTKNAEATEEGGCQMSGQQLGSSSTGLLLGALGFLGLARRRRPRAA